MSEQTIYGPWVGKRYNYPDDHETTVKFLVDELCTLKEKHGVVGIKQSFEDEGAILSDVVTMRRVTSYCDLSMFVKIGGCEAVTDINNCVSIGINSIIAPMVETPFALRKFHDSIKNIDYANFFFVCESETAFKNLENMLSSEWAKKLSGVIVGRSDLTKSFGLEKESVDSDFINEKVETVLSIAKKHGYKTTMGGNISTKSVGFVKKMYENNLLDKVETRNVVIALDNEIVSNLDDSISAALKYEIDWLNFKANNYINIGAAYSDRAEVLKGRI